MKREYESYLVEALLWGGALMVATFLVILGAWKVLGITPVSLVIWSFQLGFSGSIYMIVMPLIRCFVKSMNVEIYHFACLVIGGVAAFFTYHQFMRIQEFSFEIVGILLLAPPTGMLLALLKKKMGSKVHEPQKAV